MTTSSICVFECIIYKTTPDGIPWEIYEAISSGPVAGGICAQYRKAELFSNLSETVKILNNCQNLELIGRINVMGKII